MSSLSSERWACGNIEKIEKIEFSFSSGSSLIVQRFLLSSQKASSSSSDEEGSLSGSKESCGMSEEIAAQMAANPGAARATEAITEAERDAAEAAAAAASNIWRCLFRWASFRKVMKGVVWDFFSANNFAKVMEPKALELAAVAYPAAAIAVLDAVVAAFVVLLVVAAIMAAKPGLALAEIAIWYVFW